MIVRDQIEQDQEDFYQRILADPYFASIFVSAEHKGVTQSEIDQALSVLNPRGGKVGAAVLVLMATLVGDSPNAPGPRSKVRIDVQVIDHPNINLSPDGTGKSCSQIAEQVRMLNHLFRNGNGTVFTFAAQQPVKLADGQTCFVVSFERLAGDSPIPKVANIVANPSSGAFSQTITLTCATAGASIYYTTDGSYPSSLNPAATKYLAPFSLDEAATLRAAAECVGCRQSDVTRASFT